MAKASVNDSSRIPLSLSVVLCSWEVCKVALPTSHGYFLGLLLQVNPRRSASYDTVVISDFEVDSRPVSIVARGRLDSGYSSSVSLRCLALA